MAYLPKDYSRHESKIVFGLSFKNLMILFAFGVLAILIVKASFLNWFFKLILLLPVLILAPIFVFYKTVDGDDLVSYLFNLLLFYSSPKYLVYKKQTPKERREHNGQKV